MPLVDTQIALNRDTVPHFNVQSYDLFLIWTNIFEKKFRKNFTFNKSMPILCFTTYFKIRNISFIHFNKKNEEPNSSQIESQTPFLIGF